MVTCRSNLALVVLTNAGASCSLVRRSAASTQIKVDSLWLSLVVVLASSVLSAVVVGVPWSFLVLLVIASLPLLPMLATSILLIIATLSHLRQTLEATNSLVDGVIVAVAAIFLTASILPATELVDRILGSIDLEHSLDDLDSRLSLEDAPIGMVNCKVFHLPW